MLQVDFGFSTFATVGNLDAAGDPFALPTPPISTILTAQIARPISRSGLGQHGPAHIKNSIVRSTWRIL